ncbi:MAG TPA: glycosyltransferase family 39 protein [Acidobacteriaceae bacterium]|nr:glycosyltransferase family 39 protein [Acidobacteriaceae bacterium]
MTTRRSKPQRGNADPQARRAQPVEQVDWEQIRPAARQELSPVLMFSVLLGFISLMVCFSRGYLLLYGDAVAHLGIARRILDTRNPGLVQLGGVWLPLPHLLMLPFVQKMSLWQSGLAGTWPSLACYILSVVGLYRLCRRLLKPRWALVATAFYAVNPNLLYLATTAMTEPLFLAELIWIALVTIEAIEAIRNAQSGRAVRNLIGLGLLILAAVFTRYDGWVVGAVAWCLVTWHLRRAPQMRRHLLVPFGILTVLAISGPLLWLWYNQHFYHDPLDFMRGPYSAPAIEKRTSPRGSRHYRGWHNPAWALLFYTRTAQVVAAAWETGFLLMVSAVIGLWAMVKQRLPRASLLLWLPLPFYVYSVAYGSVPIFIPQLYPHSYYNARYGMELLPALAVFASIAVAALEAEWMTATGSRKAGRARLLYPAALGLALLNPLAMTFGTTVCQQIVRLVRHRKSTVFAIYSPPLVLKEAIVNATTRVPFERNLALFLNELPPGSTILMQESDHIGALQDAGIPLRQTINETDYDSWHAALQDPAGHAPYVVAFEGDAVARAVAEHPEGLLEISIIGGTGQRSAHIYQSQRFGAPSR